MSNNFFSTSKVLEGMLEDLPLFSDDDLNDLKDAITDELKAREHKQMMPRENSGAIFFCPKGEGYYTSTI